MKIPRTLGSRSFIDHVLNIWFEDRSGSYYRDKSDIYYVRCVRAEQPLVSENENIDLVKNRENYNLTIEDDTNIIGNLIWEKESREMSWDEGMEYAENLRLDGYDDWRLPTMEELGDIVTLCGGRITIYNDNDFNEIAVQNKANKMYQSCYREKGFSVSNRYWSSSLDDNYTYGAWCMTFENGFHLNSYRSNSYYIRCVRVSY